MKAFWFQTFPADGQGKLFIPYFMHACKQTELTEKLKFNIETISIIYMRPEKKKK